MTVSGKVLPAGKYIIVVTPEWHKSTNLDPLYKSVRVGIYCPVLVNLEKCDRRVGHAAIASCFQEIAEDMPDEAFEPLVGLPEAFKNKAYQGVS